MISSQSYPVGFTAENGLKDINLILEAGRDGGVNNMPLARIIKERLNKTVKEGGALNDWASFANQVYIEREIKSKLFTAEWSDVIDSNIESVWQLISDFNGLPFISSSIISSSIEDNKDKRVVGCIRHLILGDGGWVREELITLDDENHSFSYIIIDGTIPVINYKSIVTLYPIKECERTFIQWKGEFGVPEGVEGNFMSNEITKNVYRIGILGLKSKLEK